MIQSINHVIVALSKPNQDCFVCIPELPSHENKAFFGVFDGHGTYGDVCSRFSADKVSNARNTYERKVNEWTSDV